MDINVDIKGIWCEKYRPQTLDDIVLDPNVIRVINEISTEIPNLLFTGNPGTGKTSLAKIIVNDILKCNYLYINASDESGIDTIRHKITNFAQTKSFDGKVKVVILDEGDGLTANAQAALRNTMESYSKYCRFIITANYKHKIIPAIQSRCQVLEIRPVIENTVKRCYSILKNEGIQVDDDQKKKFVELVKANFPDIRKTINELQKNSIGGKLSINKIRVDNEVLQTINNLILSKETLDLRRFLIENEDRFNGDYDTLMSDFLNFIYNDSTLQPHKKKLMIITITEHLYRSVFVVDHELNAFACWINLEKLV